MHKQSGAQIKSIALLSAVLFTLTVAFPSVASADYVAFQNKWPATAQTIDDAMFGFSEGARVDVLYIATSTVVQFDRLDMALCHYLGTSGGRIDVEVRTTATTTTNIIASSTLAVNSGNISSSGCTSGNTNATTSTFVLNNNVQWVEGVNIWFSFYPRGGTDGTFYFTYHDMGDLPEENFYTYIDNVLMYPDVFQLYSTVMIGRALGIAPANQGGGVVYNASGTPVICSSFDVGCYISTSISYLFVPKQSTFDQFADITLASSTPFNYLYEIGGYFDTLRNGVATSTIISVDFVGNELVLYDSSNMTAVIGATNMARVTFVKTLISYALWLTLLFAVWREVLKVVRHDN